MDIILIWCIKKWNFFVHILHILHINNKLILDPAAGASDDWYRGVLETRYSFTTELRDTGSYGFALPPNQIVPSGEELFAGMKVVFEKCVADSKAL